MSIVKLVVGYILVLEMMLARDARSKNYMCKDCKECKLLYKPFKRRNKKKAVPFKELKKEVFKRDG